MASLRIGNTTFIPDLKCKKTLKLFNVFGCKISWFIVANIKKNDYLCRVIIKRVSTSYKTKEL